MRSLRRRRPSHLSYIAACIVDHIRRGRPGTAMNHGVECRLIEGYVNRLGRNFIHLANVHLLPFDAIDFGMSLSHHFDDHGRKVDA